MPMPFSRISRPEEIAAAKSPPRKNQWVCAAWMTPCVAAASIVGASASLGWPSRAREELGDDPLGLQLDAAEHALHDARRGRR